MSQIENSVSSINLKDKSVLLRVDFNHGYKITLPFVPLFSILSSALEAC